MVKLDNFNKTRVMVIGDLMLDRYWWGSVNRISPEAPVPIVKMERSTTVPGGAANVAINAAFLGAFVSVIGCTGMDQEAEQLSESLSGIGIHIDGLVSTVTRSTTTKTRIIAHGQQVVRVDQEDTSEVSSDIAEQIITNIIPQLPTTDLVILSDYAKGLFRRDLLERIFDECQIRRKPVIVDPKGKDFTKYKGAALLTPNRKEAAEACKLDESNGNLVSMAGEQIIAETGIKNILITEGENGMSLFCSEGEPVRFDAEAQQVFDVTGAGDTVISTIGVSLAAGLEMREACYIANIAGGLSVQQIGTAPVMFEHLAEAVKSASGLARVTTD